MSKPSVGSLVLYKIRPAKVIEISDKIEIELEGGKRKRVRDKDVVLLHPGPLTSFKDLTPQQGEIEENWELLDGSETEIGEFSELVFGDYTPATAWAAWELVTDGLYFEGTPGAIRARPADLVHAEREQRQAKAAEAQAWEAFVERVEQGQLLPEDNKAMGEVEALALRRRENSRILKALGFQESPLNAHRLLVKTGYWSQNENPYPRRMGVQMETPQQPVPALPEEQRLDLTHLTAYAIDDAGNQDPDDAVSLDDERIWVHVVDAAALVAPESEIDIEARSRGSNLYSPEQIVPMLPLGITHLLGLGLQQESPALSIGFLLSEAGEVMDVRLQLTRLKVERLSYDEADKRLEEPLLAALQQKAACYRARRKAAGAAFIQLPEVKIRATEEGVAITPLPALKSREMITDLMLMAGGAVAIYCSDNEIPVPFATQAPPDTPASPQDLAAMYAYVRKFKPTQVKTQPEPHSGLGLQRYTRATSPLRRYSDLLTHQQLRAHLKGEPLLDIHTISERISQAELGSMSIRKAERQSNNHWRMVYLRDHPKWQGEGVVVAIEGERASVLIPELAMEARVRMKSKPALNSVVKIAPREVDLPDLACYFRVLG